MAHRIGIIGGGNMGSAIARGCINAGVLRPDEVIIAEIDAEKRRQLAALGCVVTDDPRTAAGAEQVILAVKPQAFPDVARAIAPLSESSIVISIMGGLNSRFIRRALREGSGGGGGDGGPRIVRAMPNVACQIGAGMTAIALGEGATPGDESVAMTIFNALGRTVMLDESLMHAVTAVSGSGPAYVFLLAEAMEQAATELGIDQAVARVLVTQTILGSGQLLNQSNQDAAALRKAVTSPGGTTAAALEVFARRDFTQIVIQALTAARDRGVHLDRT